MKNTALTFFLLLLPTALFAEGEVVTLEKVFKSVDEAVGIASVGEAAEAAALSKVNADYNALGPLSLDFEVESIDRQRETRSVLSETFRPGMRSQISDDIARARSMGSYLSAVQIARSIKVQLASTYVGMRQAQQRHEVVTLILKQAKGIFSAASSSASSGNIAPLAAVRWEIIQQRMETERQSAVQVFAAGQAVLGSVLPAAKSWNIETSKIKPVSMELPDQKNAQAIAVEMSKYRSESLSLEARQEKSYFQFSAGAGVIQTSDQNQGFVLQLSVPLGQAYLQRQRSAAAVAAKTSEDKYRDLLSKQVEINREQDWQNVQRLKQQWDLNKKLSLKIGELLQQTLQGYKRGLAGPLEYLAALESNHSILKDVYESEMQHDRAVIEYYLKYKEVETL